MAELPESIGNLTSLTKLSVWDNQLTSECLRTFPTKKRSAHAEILPRDGVGNGRLPPTRLGFHSQKLNEAVVRAGKLLARL